MYWAMHTPNIKQKIALPKGNRKNYRKSYTSFIYYANRADQATCQRSSFRAIMAEWLAGWNRVPGGIESQLCLFFGSILAICSMRIALSFCQFEYTLSPPPPPLVSATTTQLCPVAAVDQGPDASQGQGQRSTRVEGRLRRSVLCSLPYPRRSNHHVFQRTIR